MLSKTFMPQSHVVLFLINCINVLVYLIPRFYTFFTFLEYCKEWGGGIVVKSHPPNDPRPPPPFIPCILCNIIERVMYVIIYITLSRARFTSPRDKSPQGTQVEL